MSAVDTSLSTQDPPVQERPSWGVALLQFAGSRKVLVLGAALFIVLSLVRWTQDATALTSSSTVESTLRFTMPILLAGLAGLWAERSGIVNIGIEGMMILGTWFGGYGAYMWGPWYGLALAIIGGAVGGLLHGVATITFNVNHIISGVAINLLAFGAMRYLSELLWTGRDAPQGAGISQSPQQQSALPRFSLPFFSDGKTTSDDLLGKIEKNGTFLISDIAGVLRGVTHEISAATILALALVPLFIWVLWRTKFGLRVRSSGEAPSAAESLGVRVVPLRYKAMAISGACAGFGGGYLAIVASSYYRQGQTANKGYIGLATMIAGNWRPTGILASGFLFGYPESLNRVGRAALPDLFLFAAILFAGWCAYAAFRRRWVLVGVSAALSVALFVLWMEVDEIPESLTGGLPYLLTIIVLATASQRLRPPAHAGQPYRPGDTH